MQNRFKSKTAWISLLMLIAFVSKTYFDYEIQEADKLINMIITVLIGFGIFNNPKDPKNY